MTIGEINLQSLEEHLEIPNFWYKKYENLPYKHLGLDPKTGIDCFNLCRLVYKEILNIEIPYTTRDFCSDSDDNWYGKIINFPMETAASEKYGWFRKAKGIDSWSEILEIFDLVLMKVDSSNYVNHCALVVDTKGRYKKLLHIMSTKGGSWVSPYGHIYETQMTEIVCKWIGMPNEKYI